jgi:GT2 family glycosyltransferase
MGEKTSVRLGGFVITFERIHFLEKMIECISKQHVKPLRIWLIDNSLSYSVRDFVNFNNMLGVEYFRTGSNLGPAGGARIGLERLAAEGFEWIYWGDDDDPPMDPRTFERLLEIADQNPNAGVIGKVGGRFFPKRARTRVFSNKELSSITEAD